MLRTPQPAPAAGRTANPASAPAGRKGAPLFTVQDLLGWAYLYPVRGLFRLLPVRFSGWLTRRLAPLYAWFRRDTRGKVESGMTLAFRGREMQDSAARLARAFIVRDVRKVVDDLLIHRLPAGALARKATVNGLDHLQAALAEGRGVIVISGHFHPGQVLSSPRRLPDAERAPARAAGHLGGPVRAALCGTGLWPPARGQR
ncbi:MAG: hypothetical protein MUE63_15705 [Xanthomonadales bacterium]|nr:hypothetical protein [Xanthomonadales bacterium]